MWRCSYCILTESRSGAYSVLVLYSQYAAAGPSAVYSVYAYTYAICTVSLYSVACAIVYTSVFTAIVYISSCICTIKELIKCYVLGLIAGVIQ